MASANELKIKLAGGNNNLNSLRLYEEKLFYDERVFPKEGWKRYESPIDFTTNPLYGKINFNKDIIFPNGDKMSYLTDTVRTFDFVATAFLDLQNYIHRHVADQWLSKDGAIAEFQPKKGYVDPEVAFTAQEESHYYIFVSKYLKEQEKKGNQVKSFVDFVQHFAMYAKKSLKISPFTKSAVFHSIIATPLASALCVEIDTLDYDNDQAKHEFIQHPNFNFYKIAARRHGFFVDRHVPWRLVADVTSHKMREYMRITHERKEMRIREENLMKELEQELNSSLPEMPHFENMTNAVDPIIISEGGFSMAISVKEFFESLADNALAFEELDAAKEEAMTKLKNIREGVKSEFSDFYEIKRFAIAIDPETDALGNAICEEIAQLDVGTEGTKAILYGKKCSSRIMKIPVFFEFYYNSPIKFEFNQIKMRLYRYYQSFVAQNPTYVSTEEGCVKEVERDFLDVENFMLEHGDAFWYKFYLIIRGAENGIYFNPKELVRHLRHVVQVATAEERRCRSTQSPIDLHKKILDIENSLRYIEKVTMHKSVTIDRTYRTENMQEMIDSVTMITEAISKWAISVKGLQIVISIF